MEIPHISELPHLREVAVVINCDTKYFAMLAALSTQRFARIPVLLMDCESTDGSAEWFRSLMKQHKFYFMEARRRDHGETLDRIFAEIPAERVLLVDSDVEVVTDEMVAALRQLLDQNPRMYASGSLHEACWLEYHYPTDLPMSPGIGYFMERPWMPFTLVRVDPVRRAIQEGHSFNYKLRRNDFYFWPSLSKLAWKRFRFQFFRNHALTVLAPFREQRAGQKPAYFFYDTGAEIHEHLTFVQGWTFGRVDPGMVPWSVKHFAGITRAVIHGQHVDESQAFVLDRLSGEYSVRAP